jgi:hypothetical protein
MLFTTLFRRTSMKDTMLLSLPVAMTFASKGLHAM